MTGKADSPVKQIRRDPSHAGLSLMRFSSSMSLLCCAKIIDRSNGISLTESNTCDRGFSRGVTFAQVSPCAVDSPSGYEWGRSPWDSMSASPVSEDPEVTGRISVMLPYPTYRRILAYLAAIQSPLEPEELISSILEGWVRKLNL